MLTVLLPAAHFQSYGLTCAAVKDVNLGMKFAVQTLRFVSDQFSEYSIFWPHQTNNR